MLLAAVSLAAVAASQELAVELRPFPGSHADSPVVAITESPDGRMWFVYQNEVRRHDGRRMTELHPAPELRLRGTWTAYSVTAFESAIYVSTSRGLWRVDAKGAALEPVIGAETLAPVAVVPAGEGHLWGLSDRGTLSRWSRAGIVPITVPGSAAVRGIVGDENAAWAWTAQHVVRLTSATSSVVTDPIPLLGIRAAAATAKSLIAATDHGLYALHSDGMLEPLSSDGRCRDARAIATGPAGIWMLTANELLRLDAAKREFLVVRPTTTLGPVAAESIGALHADSQGLLWIGCHSGVYRAMVPAAIGNHVLTELRPGENVCALVEHAGTMWLGTEHGRLLQQTPGGWTTMDTPWASEQPKRIEQLAIASLASSPTGHLVVGTRHRGAWIRRGEWHCLVAGAREVRGLAVDGQGCLWIAADREVLTADLTQPEPLAASVQKLPDPARAGSLTIDADGTVWLAAFRGGLWRKPIGAALFESLAPEWQQHVVLHLTVTGDGRHLWLATSGGLWHHDIATGLSTSIHDTAHGSVIRLVAGLPDGSVWLSQSTQLAHFSPETHTLRVLPIACGSHPGGVIHRATASCSDGSVWLGTANGYTRLAADAHRHLDWPIRLGRTTVSWDGAAEAAVLPPGGTLRTPPGVRVLEIDPILIDRSTDDELPHEIVLRAGSTANHSASGRFLDVDPGEYAIDLVTTRASGSREILRLGSLVVASPSLRWPWWLAGFAAAAGLGVWGALRCCRSVAPLRQIDLVTGDAAGGVADGIKADLAWLAVVTGEAMAQRIAPRHTSVWLHRPATGVRTRLACFGANSANAAERVRTCCTTGIEVADRVHLADHGDYKDLVVCAAGETGVEFEILLHRLPRVDQSTLADVLMAAEPLLTGVHKEKWIGRLEHDIVRKTATLEAEVHDLKSPLTVLRMSVFELTELATASQDSRVRTAADAAAGAIDSVVRSFDHMITQFHRTAELRLVLADPAQIALKVARQLQPLATHKRIQLDLFATMTVDRVMLDETWFTRVVENVVGNAIKYSPPGSTVRCDAAIVGEEFVLRVVDEGPGFTAMERESVFLPGVVGQAAPTGGESKSGMGLWIARQALRAMNGRIWIESREGRGAAVMIALPRVQPSGSAAARS